MTVIDDISEPGAWVRAIGRGCVPSACDYTPALAADSDSVGVDEIQLPHAQGITA